jgi:hypothetical protein
VDKALPAIKTDARLNQAMDNFTQPGVKHPGVRMFKAERAGDSSVYGRVQLLSGPVTIQSAPGEGTCVEVRVPLEGTQIKSMRAGDSPGGSSSITWPG